MISKTLAQLQKNASDIFLIGRIINANVFFAPHMPPGAIPLHRQNVFMTVE
jgi:hypothetical protein